MGGPWDERFGNPWSGRDCILLSTPVLEQCIWIHWACILHGVDKTKCAHFAKQARSDVIYTMSELHFLHCSTDANTLKLKLYSHRFISNPVSWTTKSKPQKTCHCPHLQAALSLSVREWEGRGLRWRGVVFLPSPSPHPSFDHCSIILCSFLYVKRERVNKGVSCPSGECSSIKSMLRGCW